MRLAASSAIAPAEALAVCRYESAKGKDTLTSQHSTWFASMTSIRDRPPRRLPSDLVRPFDSLAAGMPSDAKAQAISSMI